VGVNTAILARGTSGTASVTRLILSTLAEQLPLVTEAAPPRWVRRSRVRNLLRSMRWDLYQAGRTQPLDVLVSPCNVGLAPAAVAHVLFIQDTMVLDHPSLFDRGFRLYARVVFGLSARRATVVVTASGHAARQITRRWPAVEPRVLPWPTRSPVVEQPRSAPPDEPVVVMLGATEPHKRTTMGIEVVAMLRKRTGRAIRLEVIGPPRRAETEVQSAIDRWDPTGSWIVRAEEPTDDGVRRRLDRAWVLLQCSSDEGFCLPLLESACVALPAVHTGAGSMAEVHPYGAVVGAEPSMLVAALESLLEPEAYAAASAAALEVARRHAPAAFSAGLLALVQEAAGAGRSGGWPSRHRRR
jgi:hypothetical protein